MPVFEYRCEGCAHEWEALVRSGDERVVCPRCKGEKARKLYSVFGLMPGGTSPARPGGC